MVDAGPGGGAGDLLALNASLAQPASAEAAALEAHALAHAARAAVAQAAHAGHRHTSPREAGFVLWSTVAALILAQAALVRFRRAYPRPYAVVTLLGLWAAPCALAIAHGGTAFLALWTVFTLCCGALFRLARAKPLAASTPRRVYRALDLTYRACLSLASAAWTALLVPLLMPGLAMLVPPAVADFVISTLAFSIYFGVLTRDVGELAADTMTANLSRAAAGAGGKRDEDREDDRGAAARRLAAQYSCALCGDELRVVGEGSTVEAGGEDPFGDGDGGRGGPSEDDRLAHITEPVMVRSRDGSVQLVMPGSPAARQLEAAASTRLAERAARAAAAAPSEQQKVLAFRDARRPDGDRLFQLQCKHVFHEGCVKGWCIIGKKDTCPTCAERVDIKALLKTSPLWGNTSRLWGQLLDAVRYMVVWNPILFLGLRFFYWEMGIGTVVPPPDASAGAAAAAAASAGAAPALAAPSPTLAALGGGAEGGGSDPASAAR